MMFLISLALYALLGIAIGHAGIHALDQPLEFLMILIVVGLIEAFAYYRGSRK